VCREHTSSKQFGTSFLSLSHLPSLSFTLSLFLCVSLSNAHLLSVSVSIFLFHYIFFSKTHTLSLFLIISFLPFSLTHSQKYSISLNLPFSLSLSLKFIISLTYPSLSLTISFFLFQTHHISLYWVYRRSD